MADRIITWHIPKGWDKPISLARHYAETDYEPVGLRIFAEDPSVDGDIELDIKADGVSIMANLATLSYTTQGFRINTVSKTVVLLKGDAEETDAADFGNDIPEGSWISCEVSNLRGASGVTIQLELDKAGDKNDREV